MLIKDPQVTGTVDPTRRVPWTRTVHYWRGRKFVIAARITLPRPPGAGPLLITNRAQMRTVYGEPQAFDSKNLT